MRRTIRPELERLEGKALLSGLPASGLVTSVTAVASRTLTGAQVAETFTETNVSNHDITVEHGPSNDGFKVTQAGKTVWSPNAGVVADFLVLDVLKPHQSLSISDTWDVRSNLANPADPGAEGVPLAGTFSISNALDHGQSVANVTIPGSWSVPVRRTHIVAPRPPALVPIPIPAIHPLSPTVETKISPSSS